MTDVPPQPPALPDARMPGVGAAAAVLGFVEAGLGLGFVAYALLLVASLGADGADRGAAAAVLVPTTVLCGALALGALSLVRRTGRRLLVGATIAEVVLAVGLGLWALEEATAVYDPTGGFGYGPGPAFTVAAVLLLLVGVATPVVRLGLVSQPAVGAWLATRPPSPPVWSAETRQWVAEPRRGVGTVVAVLAPIALVLAATLVVLTTAGDPLVAPFGAGPVAGSVSPWGELYDGGTPVAPPADGDPLFEAQYDADAQDCFDGDLVACDDLYFDADSGSLYEWLGSTCGGREEYETYGLCS